MADELAGPRPADADGRARLAPMWDTVPRLLAQHRYLGAEALYLEATAGPVAGDACLAALDVLNARLPASHLLGSEDLEPTGPLRVYEALVARHFVLIRGGDTRFDNVTDARLEVTPPDPGATKKP